MSIATHAIKYGWVYLATLTLGTGTIFMADPILRRITLHDRIEVTLAIVERCLATQTGTNPATYGVDPPSIVRTWIDTDGSSVSMTNAIAWRDDLSMKIELDAKLEALCPYYVDTNSVYDGTTNIIMHTFTGLLTSLDLGDHMNFTAIPAIGATPATYGPWAWRNYLVAWQERYKVLEALKMTRGGGVYDYRQERISGVGYYSGPVTSGWAAAKAGAEAIYSYSITGSLTAVNNTGWELSALSYGRLSNPLSDYVLYLQNWLVFDGMVFFCTNLNVLDRGDYIYGVPYDPADIVYDANGIPVVQGQWKPVSFPIGMAQGDPPAWCIEPTTNTTYQRRGVVWAYQAFPTWGFQYATNKYW